MCNARPDQLAALSQINSFSVQEINDFLRRGFELSCLIQYNIQADKLNMLEKDLIKTKALDENLTASALLEAGLSQSIVEEMFDPELPPIPTVGLPPPPLVPSYDLISKILAGQALVTDVQDALLNGYISDDTLKIQCGFNEDTIDRIRKYMPRRMSLVKFADLPKLKPNRTDFYFFGLPSAGKTCLLASLLAYWQQKGICNPEVNNKRSVEYFRMLGGGFAAGVLPMNTENAFIDYIELTLSVNIPKKSFFGGTKTYKYDIPINLLDIAGERFRRVAEDFGGDGFDEHREYLKNDNPKAVFFVLDYSKSNNRNQNFTQGVALQTVLNYLDNMGILKGTDSIYLVVSKADLFPGAIKDREAFAETFVKEEYAGFKSRIESLADKYDFELKVIPYSIGPCIMGQLLADYSPITNDNLRIYPQQLSDLIESHTAKYHS